MQVGSTEGTVDSLSTFLQRSGSTAPFQPSVFRNSFIVHLGLGTCPYTTSTSFISPLKANMSFQQSGFQPTTDQGFSQSGFQPTTDQDFSQTGFQPTTDQGFSQGGFQMTYEISLFDIKSLKSSLESTALQLAEAIKVLESIDLPVCSQSQFQVLLTRLTMSISDRRRR